MTKCSIIIPTCDRPESVQRAIDSALAALKYANTAGDVIVVNDAINIKLNQNITDSEAPLNLRIVVNHGIKGPSAARNLGAQHAQTDILFFLDDDDLMEPDYIDRILKHRRSGDCKAVWGFCQRHSGRDEPGLPKKSSIVDQSFPLQKRLAATCFGFWVERTTFESLGGFDTNLRTNEDSDFCLTLASAQLMPWFEATPGIRLRGARTEGDTDRPSTTKMAQAVDRAAAWTYILEKHASLLLLHPVERGNFILRLAKFRARSGDIRGAISLSLAQHGRMRWIALVQTLVSAATSKK